MKLALLLALAACYEHPATSTTGPQQIRAREGHVAAVREVARTPASPPPGALVGAIVFHEGGATTLGTGFAAPGSPDRHAFEVVVSFDDGETGIFVYQDSSPFRPGERVLLTPGGIVPLFARKSVADL